MYFAKVDSFGELSWLINYCYNVVGWSTNQGQHIVADGKGNAILKFEKSLNDTIRFQYVQKFDKNSNSLWGENGVVYSHYNKEIISRIERTMCRDSYGGAIVVWSEFPHDIYAQQK